MRRSAGLDTARSWVILSELNEFVWPGFDLADVPGRKPRTVAYGFLTPGFFARVRDAGSHSTQPRSHAPCLATRRHFASIHVT